MGATRQTGISPIPREQRSAKADVLVRVDATSAGKRKARGSLGERRRSAEDEGGVNIPGKENATSAITHKVCDAWGKESGQRSSEEENALVMAWKHVRRVMTWGKGRWSADDEGGEDLPRAR